MFHENLLAQKKESLLTNFMLLDQIRMENLGETPIMKYVFRQYMIFYH